MVAEEIESYNYQLEIMQPKTNTYSLLVVTPVLLLAPVSLLALAIAIPTSRTKLNDFLSTASWQINWQTFSQAS